MIELRCEGTLHGRMIDDKHIEVRCGRRRCGHKPGMVILHTINIETGEVEQTKRFADPVQKGKVNGAAESSTAVRTA